MKTFPQNDLIAFLRHELAVPIDAIKLGLRQTGSAENLLPMVLWQYGLVTTQQLERIFDWLEKHTTQSFEPTA
ncbi:hypothetical protein C7293_30090 [filamentous cyanobacterium CCT1]|nr:hypothetical protein C7293_30090 [filamentous cyanobacterium CCT1]